MCKAPFEPLDKASLFYLSVKTVFLVILATARRVSEVHALSMDSDHLRFSNLDGSLILRTQLGFLAKNQLPSRAPDSIKIPKLSNLYLACNEERAFFASGEHKKYDLWSCQKVTDAFIYLLDNIYIRFGSKLYRQNVGIPMGTNCAPLLLTCFCSAMRGTS